MLGAGKSQNAEPEAVVEGLKGTGSGATAFSFGKYQLFASLGRGGMADVFLAVSRGPMGFNKLVVIKRLRPSLAEEAAFRQMFLDEARLAARLNHPNVVHTYEVGEHEGIYFIAMEYLEGQSLNKVMKEVVKRNTQLDPVYCARIIADALSGLHHAHELRDYDGRPLNIIHRDISPHNIFATYDGHVKLVDFGIAKAALSSTETEVGVLKGKVAYMAPEQAMGGPIDHRADIFAMGIVLWEILTRQRLMTGDSAANTLHRLMNLPIPPVSSILPGIDPRLDAIVAKALEKEPAARYQTSAEMRDALEQWIASTGRLVRQDDVGQFIGSMFKRLRDEVHRQIQTHMAAVATASSTGELQALTIDSLKRLEQNGNTRLLHLGTGTGSGSGVISPHPTLGSDASQPSLGSAASNVVSGGTSAPVQLGGSLSAYGRVPLSVPPPAPAGSARWALLLLAIFFGLATLVLLAIVIRPRAKTPPLDAPSATPATTAPPPSATTLPADPTPSATPSATSSAPPTATTAPPIADTATGSREPKRPPHVNVPPHPHPPPAPPAPPPSVTTAPPNDDPGYLTLQTYPYTKVSEGGRTLGTTPLVKIALPPGTHVLTLENPDQGIKQTYTVTIKSGETFSRNLGLK